ncbi:MAG: biotin/lipoyl-containing protein [Bacillota bacterium]
MRKFNITVNGKTYEVEVEEVGGVSAPARPAPVAVPKAAAPAAPAPAPKAEAPAVSGGGESVTAPMPGKVLKVLKPEGSAVKNGEVVMILEAMKMENEITAPTDGTVKQIAAKEGAAVNPGDVLFVIG